MVFDYQIKKIRHLTAANFQGGHGVHSPFLYSFFKEVITPSRKGKLPEKLLEYPNRINMTDRKVGSIMHHVINWLNKPNVIEICYLPTNRSMFIHSQNGNRSCVINHECGYDADMMDHYAWKKSMPMKFTLGDVEDVLPKLLNSRGSFDVLIVSINKQYMSENWFIDLVVKYSKPDSILIVNNLHRSENIEAFSKQLLKRSESSVFLDLFHLGIFFFNPQLQKEKYIVRF
jgi:hypothetical protein